MPVLENTIPALNLDLKNFLMRYDDVVAIGEYLSDKLNHGPDLSDEGQKVFDDFNNVMTIITAAGRFLIDEFPEDLYESGIDSSLVGVLGPYT